MSNSNFPIRNTSQQGGMTILLALILLSMMSMAAIGIASTSIRELTTTGTVLQGDKAAEAADAGLDWAVVWAHPSNQEIVAGSSKAAGALANALRAARSEGKETLTNGNEWISGSDAGAVVMKSSEASAATSGMAFNTADALVAQNQASGNKIIQRFDLQVRYLGATTVNLTTGDPQASGGTDSMSRGQSELMYMLSSIGYASVDVGDGTFVRYQQRRDLVNQQALGQ